MPGKINLVAQRKAREAKSQRRATTRSAQPRGAVGITPASKTAAMKKLGITKVTIKNSHLIYQAMECMGYLANARSRLKTAIKFKEKKGSKWTAPDVIGAQRTIASQEAKLERLKSQAK